MKNKHGILFLTMTLVAALLLAGTVLAQTGGNFDLTWWTVDGGGETVSGGSLSLTGSVGQPEPGPALSGGGFDLTSGFWPGGGEAPSESGTCNAPLSLDCGQQVNGNTQGQPNEHVTYSCVGWNETGPDTIYAFSLAAGSTYTVTAELGNLSVDLDVFLLGDCAASQCLAGNSYGDTRATAAGVPAGSYYVAVDGYEGAAGSYSLSLSCTPSGSACEGLNGVSIIAPDSGYTDVQYAFIAQIDPTNATIPITYTWSSDGLVSGQGTANAVYSWSTAGDHTVSLTAENCGGPVNDDHTITLSEPPASCDFPLTGFEIDGPTSGEVGQDLTFTSRITPANATEPVTYTWSTDGLVSGQGTDTAVYNWSKSGPQQITTSASNCGGSANDSHTVSLSQTPPTCAVPLTGVSLSGPSSGQTGQTLTFNASPQPSDATAPITYTWSSDGLVSGQGTAQASYRWSSAGSKSVQVSARNCGGQDYNDSQTVDVSAACNQPLVGVSIAGLNAGYTDVTYEFTALPDPSDATVPITYTWSSDGLVSGQGTAQASYSWTTSGTYTVSLAAANCGGSANADHSIDLEDPPPNCDAPITGVSVSGPTEGDKETDYVFTADVLPANATEPIQYTWSSNGLVSGQGTAQANYRWSQSGAYQVSLSVGNCGGSANDSLTIDIGRVYIFLPVVIRNAN